MKPHMTKHCLFSSNPPLWRKQGFAFFARRLGHSKIEETWNTYSHLYPREEERDINVLDSTKL